MLTKSRAIVLHTLRYNDNSSIVHLLTRAEGYTAFLIYRTKGKRSNVRHSIFQPLNLLEVEWDVHGTGGKLAKLRSARIARNHISIPYEQHKLAIGLFLVEFLDNALKGEPPSEAIFDYTENALAWLDEAERDFSNFHIAFLINLSGMLGFRPNFENYAEGDWFDLQAGHFTHGKPDHDFCVSPTDARLLPRLARIDLRTMHLFHFSGNERNRLLSLINDYYRLHLPVFPELKSLKVLREVFS